MKQTRDAKGTAEMNVLVRSIDGVHVGAAEMGGCWGRLLGCFCDTSCSVPSVGRFK